jgi:hypothetical protein
MNERQEYGVDNLFDCRVGDGLQCHQDLVAEQFEGQPCDPFADLVRPDFTPGDRALDGLVEHTVVDARGNIWQDVVRFARR